MNKCDYEVQVKVKKTTWFYIATLFFAVFGRLPLTITRVNGIKSNTLTLNDMIK